ncbi:MAG TPA: MmcQ/YjbR family DNA-binding protein, partial [Steroidobacteraceae bacterium]|nr:MmcQ/YjbR family DNA-binding protein [Steroidobacteraceae bacterium]
DINVAVREICLSFPEAEEFAAHGSPNFRVRGKTFAMYVVNHHGDGRIALWLNSPSGAQEQHARGEPKHFFVPPYVGPRGWLGMHLDKGLSWKRIAMLVREAYSKVAPPKLAATLGKTIEIDPPKAKMSATDFDPMQSKRAQSVLKLVRKICLAWPETSEGEQFGRPVWRVGKKGFALAFYNAKRLKLAFWVGVDRQGLLTTDERFQIPAYMGHNGWIELDVNETCNRDEVRELALASYRHFALKRILAALDGPAIKRKS